VLNRERGESTRLEEGGRGRARVRRVDGDGYGQSSDPGCGDGKTGRRTCPVRTRHRRNRKRLEGLLPLIVWWAGLGLPVEHGGPGHTQPSSFFFILFGLKNQLVSPLRLVRL
jgi:hypothetical protein